MVIYDADLLSELIKNLIIPPERMKVFYPNFDSSIKIAENLSHTLSSGISTHKITTNYTIHSIKTDSPELYLPSDKFHMSILIPSIDIDPEHSRAKHIYIEDRLSQFMCSKFNEEKMAPLHLIQLEQALNSVTVGGYVVALLPDNWQISDMRYNRWIENNVATVAKIRFPNPEISKEMDIPYNVADQYGSKIYSGQQKITVRFNSVNKWSVYIFFKSLNCLLSRNPIKCPNSMKYSNIIPWASYTYSPFIMKQEVNRSNLDEVVSKFTNSEWNRMSVFQWRQTIKAYKDSYTCFSTRDHMPIELDSLEDMFMVEGIEKFKQKILLVHNEKDIKKSKKLIQIKPTRSKVKLIGHSIESKCALVEIMHSMGYQGGELAMEHLLKLDFESVRHNLVSEIYKAGFIPCMTERSRQEIATRLRWINRQLTPIERYIKIDDSQFDLLYEEIGLRKVFSDQYAQWSQRAAKIRLNNKRSLFDFQLDDVIVQCMKDGVVNASVMGLGKTREMLISALLRGKEKILIVCPKKLIGTWQDEIEDLIIPMVRMIRRNWNGKIVKIGIPNIIEYADDCRPENLTMFNIISYDKLKAVPRDGRFFKCPKCGFVAFSATEERMRCPGEPFDFHEDPFEDRSCVGELRRWKAANRQVDEKGNLIYRKYKVHKKTGKKVHWNEDHPSRFTEDGSRILDKDCEIIDTRSDNPYCDPITGSKPQPPMMTAERCMYEKTRKVVQGKDAEGNEIIKRVPRKCLGKKFHAKWTFSELLRWRFSIIGADEIMYVNNEDSQRAQALNHLTSKVRLSYTGTPMKGLPQKIRNYVNWTTDREVFPDYRKHDTLGMKRFLDKYKTEIIVGTTETEEGISVGGVKKQIHKIRNAELFQSELSPFMIRRVRDEPDVSRDIPDIRVIYQDIKLEMDSKHKEFYKQWIEMFVEWFEAMKEEEEGKKVSGQNILAKLSYLISASINPHFMLERLKKKSKKWRKASKADDVLLKWLNIIKPYKGPMTAKMLKALDIIEDARLKKQKVLIGASRQDTLDLGNGLCAKRKIPSMVIDGRTSLETKRGQSRSERHLKVQEFRFMKYNAMWAGIKALAEGMNIPEANHVIGYDTTWEPADIDQFVGRVIRPQQANTVYVYFLMHEGTVDEYMTALCYLKGRSHSEGIDGVSFDDISADMIPDFRQYAESIVDGTESILKRNMWLQVEQIKKQWEEEATKRLHDEDVDDDDYDDENENGNGE
jgi:SNF2 family DNA or RNA helicase